MALLALANLLQSIAREIVPLKGWYTFVLVFLKTFTFVIDAPLATVRALAITGRGVDKRLSANVA